MVERTNVCWLTQLEVDVLLMTKEGKEMKSIFVEFIILAKITKYQNKIFAVESKMKVKMIFEWFLMTKSKGYILCNTK